MFEVNQKEVLTMSSNIKDFAKNTVIVGFALFSTTFGAGNLIFPPSVGLAAGNQWIIGFLAFFVSGIALPIAAYIAIGFSGGVQENLSLELGKKFGKWFLLILLTVSCPIAMPRVGSLVYEITLLPFFPNFNKLVFIILFWGITIFLALNPSKVISLLGKYMTPILLVGLAVIFVASFLFPIGSPTDVGNPNVIATSLYGGYQAMDALGMNVYAGVVMAPLFVLYNEVKTQRKIVLRTGLLAGICLVLVYGSLVFLGACSAGAFSQNTEKTALLQGLVSRLLGRAGAFTLAFVVFWACLTTSVGTAAGAAHTYMRLVGSKISYKIWVLALCVISACLSVFSVQQIITFAFPIMMMMYPCLVALVLLRFVFTTWSPKGKVGAYYGMFYVTLIFAALDALPLINVSIPAIQNFLAAIPLASIGTPFLVPAIAAGIIGFFIAGGPAAVKA
jgi:LIVCS family branched-chain amino acid:cation transporter